MPILTKSGRVVIAESISLRPIHCAWGTGDGAWTVPPSEDADATSLIAEVGRREASEVAFVVPDVDGDIILPSGNYSRSGTPTNHLLIVTNFDFGDASSTVIREIGIYVGTTVVGGLPGGQKYFVPAEVATPGRLLHVENMAPIFRSPAIRENFEVVITF
jgi:hypothetical protein